MNDAPCTVLHHHSAELMQFLELRSSIVQNRDTTHIEPIELAKQTKRKKKKKKQKKTKKSSRKWRIKANKWSEKKARETI